MPPKDEANEVLYGRPVTAAQAANEDWQALVQMIEQMRESGAIHSDKPPIVIVGAETDLKDWPDFGAEILRDRNCPSDQIQVMDAEDYANHTPESLKALYAAGEDADEDWDGPWYSDQFECRICRHRFIGVGPYKGTMPTDCECPKCGNMSADPADGENE